MGQVGVGSAEGYGLMGLTPSDQYFGGLGAQEKPTKKLKFSKNFSYFGLSLWSLQTQKYLQNLQNHQIIAFLSS